MNNKLLQVTIPIVFVLFSGFRASAQYTPDTSMSLATFQEIALQPKQEMWVLDFWASWCKPCIASVPRLKLWQKEYAAKGVKFISLSWDEEQKPWVDMLMKQKMPWTHIWIPFGDEAIKTWFDEHFPHKGIPTAFIIMPDGKIRKVAHAEDLDDDIDKALEALKKAKAKEKN